MDFVQSTPRPRGRENGPAGDIPSSSPAFATPAHPILLSERPAAHVKSAILPIKDLPPARLRPIAFRVFTKKHNLNLTAPALEALATFIGENCGSRWRDEGLAEPVLEEIAKSWKRRGGALIVDGKTDLLKSILDDIGSTMEGGRMVPPDRARGSTDAGSGLQNGSKAPAYRQSPLGLSRETSNASFGRSSTWEEDEKDDERTEPRHWLRVIGAFEQPRFSYNAERRHFEKITKAPSLFPDPLSKTTLFRDRYNLIQQRLMRNESFQAPAIAASRATALHRTASITTSQTYKLTPIANLLGRAGTSHVILGLLTVSPTGGYVLSDLTGSVPLDTSHARIVPDDGIWLTPGMIVVVDGIYEEDGAATVSTLGGSSGVGGTIGGKIVALSIGGPPCERRDVTLGIGAGNSDRTAVVAGGFGWVDFLGVGSERSVGQRMRERETHIFSQLPSAAESVKLIVLGELHLDNPRSVTALKKVLSLYDSDEENETPMAFVLAGNFFSKAVMASADGAGSVEFKEALDGLASALSEYPTLLQRAKFIFTPGDNDPWVSASSAGAATVIPRASIPDMFTSRIRRTFSTNADSSKGASDVDTRHIWTTNPSRLSLFGTVHEILIFRDNISGRLRRNAVRLQSEPSTANRSESQNDVMDVDGHGGEAAPQPGPDEDTRTARKLVKTLLDQGHLSPFPLSKRPVLWDYGSSLQLYPLPTAMMLVDPEAPAFAITYEGCHVMNPGCLVADARRSVAKWVEYSPKTRRGKVMDALF